MQKSDGQPRPFIGLENIASRTGQLISPSLPTQVAPDSVLHAPGDVLFSKLRPYLAKSYMPNARASATGELLVLRPSSKIDKRFLLYVTLSAPWLEWAEATSYGSKMPRTSWEAMSEYRLAIPSIHEQRRISTFLDAETARIDNLIALRDAQVANLAEALASESSRLTGRCIRDQPPGSWHRLPFRRVVDAVQTGLTPTDFLQSLASADTVPWYTPAALDDVLGLTEPQTSVRRADLCYVPRFPAGSLLMVGIGESLGKVAVLGKEATGNQQLTCIKVRVSADTRFLAWQLRAAYDEIRSWAQYSRVKILNNENLLAFPMMIPSLKDQVAARTELDGRLNDLKRFRAAAARFSALAFERRQTLITAAVTGQIDVATARGATL